MSTTSLAPPAPAAAGAGRRAGPRRSPLHHLRRWVSPVVLVALWQALSSAGVITEAQMASPAQIVRRAVQLVQDGELGTQTLISVQRVLLGVLIGGAIGLVLAVVAGLSRIAED